MRIFPDLLKRLGGAVAWASGAFGGAPSMEELFWKRAWGAVEQRVIQEGIFLSLSDATFAANAFWMQKRYGDAVDLLAPRRHALPPEVRVYADLMLVLGYERTNRREEALKLGKDLWPRTSADVRYYVAYALARIYRDEGKTSEGRLPPARPEGPHGAPRGHGDGCPACPGGPAPERPGLGNSKKRKEALGGGPDGPGLRRPCQGKA